MDSTFMHFISPKKRKSKSQRNNPWLSRRKYTHKFPFTQITFGSSKKVTMAISNLFTNAFHMKSENKWIINPFIDYPYKMG